jgi:hypothetical protein
MPKRNKHSQKAREREAAKQGEITLAFRTYAKEISADPTYEDFEMGPVVASTSSTILDNDAMDLDRTAKQLVPECLSHVKILNIRHYFRLCHRYLEPYQ